MSKLVAHLVDTVTGEEGVYFEEHWDASADDTHCIWTRGRLSGSRERAPIFGHDGLDARRGRYKLLSLQLDGADLNIKKGKQSAEKAVDDWLEKSSEGKVT
jgi:hypothetical protein